MSMSSERGSGPAAPRFRGLPTNEIPATVPLHLVLARTDAIAVWLSGALVYSTGISFSVEASVRTTDRPLGMYGFGKPESGSTPPMLLGFEYADGTLATNLPGRPTALRPNGSTGSGVHRRTGLILTPVPPPGALQVYLAWPYFGIEETKHEIDAALFSAAVAEVTKLWEEPDLATAAHIDLDNLVTPAIEIPEGGWFAAAAARQKPPPRDPNSPRRINYAFVEEGPSPS